MVFHYSNNDIYFDLLMKFKKVFMKGGAQRMKYTLPALIFSLIRFSSFLYNRVRAIQDPNEPEF